MLLVAPEAYLAGPAGTVLAVGLLVADIALPVPASLIMAWLGATHGLALGALYAAAGMFGAAMIGFALGRLGTGAARRVLGDASMASAARWLDAWGMVAVAASRPMPMAADDRNHGGRRRPAVRAALRAGGGPRDRANRHAVRGRRRLGGRARRRRRGLRRGDRHGWGGLAHRSDLAPSEAKTIRNLDEIGTEAGPGRRMPHKPAPQAHTCRHDRGVVFVRATRLDGGESVTGMESRSSQSQTPSVATPVSVESRPNAASSGARRSPRPRPRRLWLRRPPASPDAASADAASPDAATDAPGIDGMPDADTTPDAAPDAWPPAPLFRNPIALPDDQLALAALQNLGANVARAPTAATIATPRPTETSATGARSPTPR